MILGNDVLEQEGLKWQKAYVEVGLRLASRMHGGDLNEVSVENVGEFYYGVFESFAIG